MSTRRLVAIGFVALLHVVLAYALVSGLAVRVARQTMEDLNVFDVEEEPPPPEEEPPPPPPDQPIPPPPVQVTQPPIIRQAAPIVAPPPPVRIVPIPRPAPPPPPPPPPSQAAPPQPRNNPGSWVTDADYPSASIRNEEQGTAGFRLTVDANGRVTGCTITSSTGHARLDSETCRLITRRARFRPAQDDAGNDTSGTYTSSIRWQIPN